MWYSVLEKNIYSSTILHQHWYTCPITLPVRRNPQHIRCLSHFHTPLQPHRHQRNVCHPVVNSFTWRTLPSEQEWLIFFALSHLTTKTHNSTLHFGITHSSTVAILTTETSLWTCACACATKTVMNLDCAATEWYTHKTYYVHYSCFTSICALYTDSP
jgi:hypothetical protein